MTTRLNPATADTYPNPTYQYSYGRTGTPTYSPGSAGNVTIGASARPEAPGPGSTKKQIAAYAESLAAWEREQMWRQIPANATQQEIEDWYGEARFDLPTQERREYDIYRSMLPAGPTAKQQAIEAQYAQQKGTILSSSGILRPTGTETYSYVDDSGWYQEQGTRVTGWQNVTRGGVFAPTDVKPEVLGVAAQSVGGAVVPVVRASQGMIGDIAHSMLSQDYIVRGGVLPSIPQQKAPEPTGVAAPDTTITPTTGPKYGSYTFREGIKDYWTLPVAAGAMIALDYMAGVFDSWKTTADTTLPEVVKPATHAGVGFVRFFPESFMATALVVPAVEFAVREPVAFAQSVVPGSVAMGAGMLEQAMADPWEAAGMAAGALVGPKIARSVFPIKDTGAIGIIDMGSKKPQTYTYRGLYYESPFTSLKKTLSGGGYDWVGVKHLAGVTTAPKGATPKFTTTEVLGKQIKVSTGLPKHLVPLVGEELFVPDVGSILTVPLVREGYKQHGSPGTLKAFDALTAELWAQKTTKAPMMKNPYIEIELVKTVPKGRGAELLDTINVASHGEYKIGGSYGKRVQGLYEGEMGDVDLYVAKKYQPGTTERLIQYYSQYLGKENVRIKGSGGVEIRTGGDWKHAVDMHILEDYQPGMRIGRYDVPIGKPVIVEGVKLVPYHELTARYITESMHLLKTKEGWKLGPDYHRGKDVAKSLATLYELRAAYAKSINPIKASRIKTLESAIEGMEVMTEEGYFPVKKVWHGKKQVTYDIYADVMAGLEKRRFMFSAGYEPVYPEEIPVGAVSDWSGLPIPQDVPISKVFHHVEYPNKGVWLTPEEHATLHGMTEGKIPVMEIPKKSIIWEPDIDTPVNLPSFLQEPGRQVGKPGTFYHATPDLDFLTRIQQEGSFVVRTHGQGSLYPQEGFFFGPRDTVYTQFLYDMPSYVSGGGTGGGLLRLQSIPKALPSKATRLLQRQETILRLSTGLEEFPQFRKNILAEADRLGVQVEVLAKSSVMTPEGEVFAKQFTGIESESVFKTLPKGKLYPGVDQFAEFIVPEGSKVHVTGTSKVTKIELPGFKETETVLDYGPLSDEIPFLTREWSWGSIERIPVVDISLGEVIPTKAFFKKYVPLTQSRYTRLPLTRRYVDLSVWESRIFDPLYSKLPAPYREWGIPSGYPWGIIEERIIKQKIVSEPKIKGSLPSSAISSVLDTIDSAAPKGRVKTTGQKYPIARAKTIKTQTPVLVSGESAGKYPVGKPTKPRIPRVLGQPYKAPRKRPEEERTPEYFTTIIYPPGKTPVKPPTITPKTTPEYPPTKPPKTPPLKPPTDIPPTYPPGRPPKVPPNIPPTSPPGYPPGRPPGRPPTYPPPRTPPPKVPPPETPPPETPPRYPPPVFPPPPTPPKYPPVKPPKAPPVIIQLTVTTPHRRKEKREYPGKLNRVWPEFFPYAQHAPVISPTSMLKGVLSGKKLKPVRS